MSHRSVRAVRWRRLLTAFLFAAFLGAGSGPSAALAGWASPVQPAGGAYAFAHSAVAAPDGTTWIVSADEDPNSGASTRHLRQVRADGSFGPSYELATTFGSRQTGIVAAPDGSVTVAWAYSATNDGSQQRVVAQTLRSGAVGVVHTLDSGGQDESLEVTPTGSVGGSDLIVWSRWNRGTGDFKTFGLAVPDIAEPERRITLTDCPQTYCWTQSVTADEAGRAVYLGAEPAAGSGASRAAAAFIASDGAVTRWAPFPDDARAAAATGRRGAAALAAWAPGDDGPPRVIVATVALDGSRAVTATVDLPEWPTELKLAANHVGEGALGIFMTNPQSGDTTYAAVTIAPSGVPGPMRALPAPTLAPSESEENSGGLAIGLNDEGAVSLVARRMLRGADSGSFADGLYAWTITPDGTVEHGALGPATIAGSKRPNSHVTLDLAPHLLIDGSGAVVALWTRWDGALNTCAQYVRSTPAGIASGDLDLECVDAGGPTPTPDPPDEPTSGPEAPDVDPDPNWRPTLDRSLPTTLGYAFPNKTSKSWAASLGLSRDGVLTRKVLEGVFTDLRGAPASRIRSIRNAVWDFMDQGMCFGFALSGSRFAAEQDELTDSSAGRTAPEWSTLPTHGRTRLLPEPNVSNVFAQQTNESYNRELFALLSGQYSTQFSTEYLLDDEAQRSAVIAADKSGGAQARDAVRRQLTSVLFKGRSLYTTDGRRLTGPGNHRLALLSLIWRTPETDFFGNRTGKWKQHGHTVVAYGVRNHRTDAGFFVDVWDNNATSTERRSVNVHADGTWAYAGVHPSQNFDANANGNATWPGVLTVAPVLAASGLHYDTPADSKAAIVRTPVAAALASVRDAEGAVVDGRPVASATEASTGAAFVVGPGTGSVTTNTSAEFEISGGGVSTSVAAPGPAAVDFSAATGTVESDVAVNLAATRGDLVVQANGARSLTLGADGIQTSFPDGRSASINVKRFAGDEVVGETDLSGAGNTLRLTNSEIVRALAGSAPGDPDGNHQPGDQPSGTLPSPSADQPAAGGTPNGLASAAGRPVQPTARLSTAKAKAGKALKISVAGVAEGRKLQVTWKRGARSAKSTQTLRKGTISPKAPKARGTYTLLVRLGSVTLLRAQVRVR